MPALSPIASPAAHAAIVNLRMFPSCIEEMPHEQEAAPPWQASPTSDVRTVSVSWVLLKTRPVQTGHIGKYLNEASAYS
jgi:hypothetical protein